MRGQMIPGPVERDFVGFHPIQNVNVTHILKYLKPLCEYFHTKIIFHQYFFPYEMLLNILVKTIYFQDLFNE